MASALWDGQCVAKRTCGRLPALKGVDCGECRGGVVAGVVECDGARVYRRPDPGMGGNHYLSLITKGLTDFSLGNSPVGGRGGAFSVMVYRD